LSWGCDGDAAQILLRLLAEVHDKVLAICAACDQDDQMRTLLAGVIWYVIRGGDERSAARCANTRLISR